VVTAVRNQKNCGACWAVSVVEVIESVYAIKTGSLQTFSVQEVRNFNWISFRSKRRKRSIFVLIENCSCHRCIYEIKIVISVKIIL